MSSSLRPGPRRLHLRGPACEGPALAAPAPSGGDADEASAWGRAPVSTVSTVGVHDRRHEKPRISAGYIPNVYDVYGDYAARSRLRARSGFARVRESTVDTVVTVDRERNREGIQADRRAGGVYGAVYGAVYGRPEYRGGIYG
jgi:hypothetical protein